MQRVRGVGIGFRSQLASDLLRAPGRVDFLEVIAEACFGVDFLEVIAEACFASPRAAREARALAEVWPVPPRGLAVAGQRVRRGSRERKKRVDAAIALLPELSAACADLRALGAATLRDRPRPRAAPAVADARALAAEAARVPAFADAAALDALLLRARFTDGSTARTGPFVGKTRAFATTFWAVTAPGASAPIHLHPRLGANEALS